MSGFCLACLACLPGVWRLVVCRLPMGQQQRSSETEARGVSGCGMNGRGRTAALQSRLLAGRPVSLSVEDTGEGGAETGVASQRRMGVGSGCYKPTGYDATTCRVADAGRASSTLPPRRLVHLVHLVRLSACLLALSLCADEQNAPALICPSNVHTYIQPYSYMTPVILRPLSLFLSKQSTTKPTPQTILRCITTGTKALAKYKYRLRSTLSIFPLH